MKAQRRLKTCDHIGLFSDNPKKLINFYVKKLGFEKEKEDLISKDTIYSIFGISLECRLIRLSAPGIKIEIFSSKDKPKRKKFKRIKGINHWGLSTGDRQIFLKKLIKRKVKIVTIKRNSHKVYFIRDPERNLIEIRD